eukprot:6582974-Pyramimonas_sp.AAC.1
MRPPLRSASWPQKEFHGKPIGCVRMRCPPPRTALHCPIAPPKVSMAVFACVSPRLRFVVP